MRERSKAGKEKECVKEIIKKQKEKRKEKKEKEVLCSICQS